jgi:hypothetical protein
MKFQQGGWGIPTGPASISAIFGFKNTAGVILPVFIEYTEADLDRTPALIN